MKVEVKDFSVDMELKNTGVELQVNNSAGAHLGDLIVTASKLIWCNGRTRRAQGTNITWADFIAFAATKAAANRVTKKSSVRKEAAKSPRRSPEMGRTRSEAVSREQSQAPFSQSVRRRNDPN